MVRLWYSNHLEQLVVALVEKIREERAGSDPFTPVRIVVPNRNLATFLKFEVARHTGILANVQFEYLYGFFRDLVPESADVELLDRHRMHAILVDAFADPELRDRADLQPIFDYISASDGEDGRQRRRFQLAQQVGRVFEEYTLSRPRMLDVWPNTTLFEEEPWRSAEAWQRALWLEVFGPEGRVEKIGQRQGRRLLPLADLVSAVPVNQLDLPETAHFFGLSYVARAFYGLFYRIASLSELNIYTLNPCMEYWEDVPTGWRVPQRDTFLKRHAEHPTLTFSGEADLWEYEDDVAPLRLWGRPGRDNVRLLNILTNCDFEARFVDPMADGDTLLHRIQRDILTRHPARTTPEFDYRDDSVQLLECPTIQREVESVANAIWELKREAEELGERLDFNEIAVIVSARQREAYQARIRSVFQNTHDIPHNIVDISAASHRRFLEAVHLLLRLPFGELARNELLKLLTHPNVLAHCDGVDRDTWVRWVDDLGILFGADREELADTYIEEDLYTWDQGMKRLTLGAFMAGEPAGETRLWESEEGFAYVPYETGQQELDSVGQLLALVRGLIADTRALEGPERPLAEWMEVASNLVNVYLEPDDDDDTYERMRVLDELSRIAELDLVRSPIPYRVAWEFIADALGRLEISRGQYLAEGVVVSSFLPMRPIPFKVVFVTGMGEKYFPRAETRSPLDLRWAKREIGDVFSTREQDEYMFLETLVSTREKFILSYVSRDAQTGERLEPSPVVRELLFMIERGYTREEGLGQLVREMPLRRWDEPLAHEEIPEEPVVEIVGRFEGDDDVAPWEIEASRPGAGPESRPETWAGDDDAPDQAHHPTPPIGVRAFQPEAQAEARAARLRESFRTFQEARGLARVDWQTIERNLEPERRAALQRQFGIHSRPDDELEVRTEVEITINQMRNFLRSPLQGSAAFFLDMRAEVFEDPIEVEDEVIETGRRELFLLLRDVFMRSLSQRAAGEESELRALYDRETRRRELQGKLPTGLFREAERIKHLRLLRTWGSNLERLQIDTTHPLRAVTFGGRAATDVEIVRAPAIRLDVPVADGRTIEVKLTGRTYPFDQAATSLQLRQAGHKKMTPMDENLFFRGFLDLMWLAAGNVIEPKTWRVALDPTSLAHTDRHLRTFRRPSASEARAYLVDIASDMLSGAHAYRMPIECVFAYRLEDWLEFHDRLDKLHRDQRERYSSYWGPVRHPERFEAPHDVDELIARRFGPYFDHLDRSGGRR